MITHRHLLRRSCTTAIAGASLIAAAMLGTAPSSASAQERRPSDVPAGELARVTRIINAETLEVRLDDAGPTRLVTLLGIDAPTGGECQAGQAAATVSRLTLNRLVRLQRDVDSAAAIDGDSLPRFVYRVDGPMLQEELLKAGLARNAPASIDALHAGAFAVYQQTAATARKGAWSACGWAQTSLANTTSDGCVVLPIERLMTRIAKLPELATLADGACVTVVKARNNSGEAWSGVFTYRPRGSAITAGTLYARWKDGFVLVSPNADGVPQAHVVEDTYRRFVLPNQRDRYQNATPGLTRVRLQTLERPDNDATLLRIPDPQTNLFRDRGDGRLEALTDVFVLQSGEARVPRFTVSGDVE